MTTRVAVSIGRGRARHAAAEVSPGVLTPVTACGRAIRSDHAVVTGPVVISCRRCRATLGLDAS